MTDWRSTGVIPAELSDGAVEALACIYVGRIAGRDPDDVVLGEYEQAVILVAQAEVACMAAAGERVSLWFSGPPLAVEVRVRPFDGDAD